MIDTLQSASNDANTTNDDNDDAAVRSHARVVARHAALVDALDATRRTAQALRIDDAESLRALIAWYRYNEQPNFVLC